MRKRVIMVPKDSSAEIALEYNEVGEDQFVELVLGEQDYLFLYKNGIIDLINNLGNANIDDFEDDSVVGEKNLKKVLRGLKGIENNYVHNPIELQLIEEIYYLFREALDRRTGVYFFF